MKVEIESQAAESMPVTITMEEWMRRMKDMSRMGGGMGFYGSLPDRAKVAVNANHRLIRKMLEAEPEQQSRLAKQAFRPRAPGTGDALAALT